MNITIKEKWCEALESGDYAQAQGCLKGEAGYCCLGVLTDLYLKDKGLSWNNQCPETKLAYSEGCILHEEIIEWAELRLGNPIIDEARTISAIGANDQLRLNFKEIAGLIRTASNL
jgi:hypothetical protein